MSTLKTTLKLESTTLFPTAINFTKAVTEQINGEYGSFQTNVLSPSGMEELFDNSELMGNSGVLYFYLESASTNPANGVDLLLLNKTTNISLYFAKVLPGDIMYLPINSADANGITISARNNDNASPATVTYFYGAKG